MENAAIMPAVQRRFPLNIVVILIGFYSFPDIVAVNDARALTCSCGICEQTGEASGRPRFSAYCAWCATLVSVTPVAPAQAEYFRTVRSPGSVDRQTVVFRPQSV